ncbi:MAG TPA: hypothetical protein VFF64_17265 [Candidatus Eremiobacteraceae bacterium]|nr:hypothetical protein [Candidatus Eremiobacteraceae bacterium]
MLPFNSLASNPLENVRRAIAQLDPLILAIAQEPNGIQIDKVYFGQIEDRDALWILDALPEFPDATGADAPDQTQDRPRTVGFCFNSKHRGARYSSQSISRMQFGGLTHRVAYATRVLNRCQ